MTDITKQHYDTFETKELAQERIKAEEAERNSTKNEILSEIKLLNKNIENMETKIENSSLKTRNWIIGGGLTTFIGIAMLIFRSYFHL